MGNTVELVKKYLKPIYVETGCSAGDGILKAVEAGATKLFGIEPNLEVYSACLRKTFGMDFKLFEGTSERFMGLVMSEIDRTRDPAVIFLDAHKVGCCKGETYPLKHELSCIKKAKRKDHVIMIDDVRLFGGELPDTRKEVEAVIRKINKDYQIVYEDSNTNEKDVLVAFV